MLGSYIADQVAAVIAERSEGTITLTRVSHAAVDPAKPWNPGAVAATDVYTLDAVCRGAAADYVDGTTVLASDLMIVTSPKARAADGTVVDLIPVMADTIQIDGAAKTIKIIKPAPASGPAALFRIFVAS